VKQVMKTSGVAKTTGKNHIGRAAAAVFVLAAVLLAVYIGFAQYFRYRFPFRTYYRGQDVSEREPAAIEAVDREAQTGRFVTVIGRDGAMRRYGLASWLGYRESAEPPEGGFLPSPWAWPQSLWRDTVIDAPVRRSYDARAAEKAAEAILRLHEDAPVLPENAWLDRTRTPYEIVPEVEGNLLDESIVRALVKNTLLPQMQEGEGDILIDLDRAGAYVKPEVRRDDAALTAEADAHAELVRGLGDTYIEVSVEAQRLRAYADGRLVCETDVVTGNAGNHATPKGAFRILGFQRNVTLKGADYESFVSYWMPITHSGVGLHDATWRSEFGGSIYTQDGSHGCVNLPFRAAEELYYTFTVGTPVVIH